MNNFAQFCDKVLKAANCSSSSSSFAGLQSFLAASNPYAEAAA